MSAAMPVLEKLIIMDFDQTITTEHSFLSRQHPKLQDGMPGMKQGFTDASNDNSRIKPKTGLPFINCDTLAIATHHNNPDYIAGYLAGIWDVAAEKIQTLGPNRTEANGCAVKAYKMSTRDGEEKTVYVSYIDRVGKDFDTAKAKLNGKNEQLALLLDVMTEAGVVDAATTIDYYDDSADNFEKARHCEITNPLTAHLVDPKNEKFSVLSSHKKIPLAVCELLSSLSCRGEPATQITLDMSRMPVAVMESEFASAGLNRAGLEETAVTSQIFKVTQPALLSLLAPHIKNYNGKAGMYLEFQAAWERDIVSKCLTVFKDDITLTTELNGVLQAGEEVMTYRLAGNSKAIHISSGLLVAIRSAASEASQAALPPAPRSLPVAAASPAPRPAAASIAPASVFFSLSDQPRNQQCQRILETLASCDFMKEQGPKGGYNSTVEFKNSVAIFTLTDLLDKRYARFAPEDSDIAKLIEVMKFVQNKIDYRVIPHTAEHQPGATQDMSTTLTFNIEGVTPRKMAETISSALEMYAPSDSNWQQKFDAAALGAAPAVSPPQKR